MKITNCHQCGKKIIVMKLDNNKCTDCIMQNQLEKKKERNKKHKPIGKNRMGGARIPKHYIIGQTRVREDGRINNGSSNKPITK